VVEVTNQIVVETNSLKWLLQLAQRKQTIDGKSIPQIHSAMLMAENGRLRCGSLVKDGVTSLINVSIPCHGNCDLGYAISDIDNVLGILKYHGGVLTMINKGSKIVFKSGSKQTTITGNTDSRAFPHTAETMAQWYKKSQSIINKIDGLAMTYTKNDGSVIEPTLLFSDLNTTSLYEAFRCDSMNGQKFNKYKLSCEDGNLYVDVGEELKGKTKSLVAENCANIDFESTYNGGLEEVFRNLNSDVNIAIWDFTEADMGYPMLITLGDGDFIFQMSNLGE